MLTSGLLLCNVLLIFREFPSLLTDLSSMPSVCSDRLPLLLSKAFGLRLAVAARLFPWSMVLPGWILLLPQWLPSLWAHFDNLLQAPSPGRWGRLWRCRADCVCCSLSHDSELGTSKRLAMWSLSDLSEKQEFPSQSNPASPHHLEARKPVRGRAAAVMNG